MADSQLILELMFLHVRGGCSRTVLLFFLMLVGTCCFILSASLRVVRPKFKALYMLLAYSIVPDNAPFSTFYQQWVPSPSEILLKNNMMNLDLVSS